MDAPAGLVGRSATETHMSAARFDKSKLPSRHVTVGPSRAPHRSYYYAMGLTEEQIKQRAMEMFQQG